jgi:hypothetical protein
VPRVLTLQRTLVTPAERKKFEARVRERRAYFEQAQCPYWVFEEAELPGAFLEFVEATDRKLITKALASAPGQSVDPNRIYVEVELS